jgi:hypothetical protein
MSTRVRSIMIFFILLVLLGVTAGPVAAGSKTFVTAYECCEIGEFPGKEFFPDGRYHLRGAASSFDFWSDDPRLDDATNRITLNANFVWMPEPIFAAGRMWGKFVLTNDGGWWEGTWTGVREKNGFSYFHFVGKGGGGYEGLQLHIRGERLDPDPSVTEVYHGYILETGN